MNSFYTLLFFQVTMAKVFCDKVPYPLAYSISLYPPASDHLPYDSLFGYSAAYQPKMKKFIVGAPRSDKYGSIFICDAEINQNQCVKNQKPIFDGKHYQQNHGSFYWGANIITNSDFYMSCAPRTLSSYGTEGKCFYQTYNEMELQNVLSLETGTLESDLKRQVDINNSDRWGSFNAKDLKRFKNGEKDFPREYYSTSFGWSIEITNVNTILVGGPAGFSGRVILYHNISDLPRLIKLDNLKFKKSNGSVLFNFGYSITSGKFFDNRIQYAISTPYGDIGEGKILLFDEYGVYMKKTIVDEEQIGTMFGASLASAKLDGKLTYLLVGSPTYSQSISSGEAQLGAVRIYKPVRGNWLLHKTIIGFESEGYFGLKVVRITDVNTDKIDDVVISAPYENKGRGAIYIYSGAELISSASKVPYLQKVEGSAPSGYYGLSVTLIEDFDENGCNELAVGEPGSNRLGILRCIATIDVDLKAQFPDLKVDSSLVKNEGENYFFFFRPCVYIKHPEKPVNISTEIFVKTTLKHPHATILGNDYFVERVSLMKEYCGMVKINLPKEGNYDRPLQLDVQVSIKDPSVLYDKHNVTLSDVSNTSLSGFVWGVGSELELYVDTTMKDGYIISSTDTESITVTVVNVKNIAHQPCVHIDVFGASIMMASDTCKSSQNTLTCAPTSILYTTSRFINQITLDTKKIESSLERITIKANLLKDCQTPLRSDDPKYMKHIEIYLSKDILGKVTGESIPSSVMSMAESDLLQGHQIIKHAYKINNEGITTWTGVKCEISLPPYVTAKVHLDSESCDKLDRIATCTINKLPKNDTVIVFVTITIPSGSNMKKLSGGNITTSLVLLLDKDQISQSVTTTILLEDTRIPIWMLAAAIVLGLIILVFIYFILKECGCFRRINKEKLQELKKEVKRQSIRRSIRDSVQKMEFRKNLEEHLKLVNSRENINCEGSVNPDEIPRPKRNSASNVNTTRPEIH